MKANSPSERKHLRCPRCGRIVSRKAPCLPFCSKRCKMIDLGTWLEEEYRIDGEHTDNIEVKDQ